jgi:class 3 adenylate cyclase
VAGFLTVPVVARWDTGHSYQETKLVLLSDMSDLSISLPPTVSEGRPIFLFTDIERSTPLWEKHREAMLAALLQHNAILEQQIPKHGGRILELRGDGVKAVFEGVDPLPCVLDILREFGRADWGELGELKIRSGTTFCLDRRNMCGDAKSSPAH